MDLESLEGYSEEENLEDNVDGISPHFRDSGEVLDGGAGIFQSSSSDSVPGGVVNDGNDLEHQIPEEQIQLSNKGNEDNVVLVDSETEIGIHKEESGGRKLEVCEIDVDDLSNKQAEERHLPNAVLPLLRYYQYESSESSSR